MMDALRSNNIGVWRENFLRDLADRAVASPEAAA